MNPLGDLWYLVGPTVRWLTAPSPSRTAAAYAVAAMLAVAGVDGVGGRHTHACAVGLEMAAAAAGLAALVNDVGLHQDIGMPGPAADSRSSAGWRIAVAVLVGATLVAALVALILR
jgi:hypothetical protein